MSENESPRAGMNEEQGDEVEGHMRSPRVDDEGDTEGENDVEAHSTRPGTPKTL